MDQTSSPIDAVIFDLDGVLVDSEPLLFEAERLLLAEHGVELTPELKKPYIGLGGRDVLVALTDRFGIVADVDEMAARKMALFLELAEGLVGFPATVEFAKALHADGVRLAIASGSSPEGIDTAMRATGLEEVFPIRVAVKHVPRGKPAPDLFLEAARQLGVEPSRCVVVEDAVHGLEAAHAAGMRCIAIPSVTDPLDETFRQADLLVPGGIADVTTEELIAWVRARR